MHDAAGRPGEIAHTPYPLPSWHLNLVLVADLAGGAAPLRTCGRFPDVRIYFSCPRHVIAVKPPSCVGRVFMVLPLAPWSAFHSPTSRACAIAAVVSPARRAALQLSAMKPLPGSVRSS